MATAEIILLLFFSFFVFILFKLFNKFGNFFRFVVFVPMLLPMYVLSAAFNIWWLSFIPLLFPLSLLQFPKRDRFKYEKWYTKWAFTLDIPFLLLPLLCFFKWFRDLFVIAHGEQEISIVVGPFLYLLFIVFYHITIWHILVEKPKK